MIRSHALRLLFALTLLTPSSHAAELQTLTDTEGRAIEAEVLELSEDAVKVRIPGRGEFDLEWSRLSPETREALEAREAERKQAIIDAAPKPGEEFSFEFPELPVDFHGTPAAMKLKMPADYDPTRPAPLLIFLPGGKGGNNPHGGGLSKGDFVLAGLPFPDNGRNPNQHNMVGSFDEVWEYWQPMLRKIEETVPNLDPRVRVIGGFSNGAHAIDGLLAEPEFSEFFSAFVLIDGGGALGDSYRRVDDKPIYIAWGETSPNKPNSQVVIARARRGDMRPLTREMTGVGHAFPQAEKDRVVAWLYDSVLPELAGEGD